MWPLNGHSLGSVEEQLTNLGKCFFPGRYDHGHRERRGEGETTPGSTGPSLIQAPKP